MMRTIRYVSCISSSSFSTSFKSALIVTSIWTLPSKMSLFSPYVLFTMSSSFVEFSTFLKLSLLPLVVRFFVIIRE